MSSGICRTLWARLVRPPSRIAVEHRRGFKIFIRTYLFVTFVHIAFIPGFAWLGEPILLWLNFVCISMNLLVIRLHHQGWLMLALLIKLSGVSALIIAAGMLLGSGTGFEYYFFVVLFEVLISDLSRRHKSLLSILLLCLALGSVNVINDMASSLPRGEWVRDILLTINLANTFALFFFIILQVHSITETTEQRFRIDATHDSLTGVLNRRAILERANELWQQNIPHALMLLDADHFKQINDNHGHSIGDEVLRYLAQTLRRTLRDNDAIGRVGGEEFLVLLPYASRSEAQAIGKRLQDRLASQPCRLESLSLSVTLSMGLAQSREVESLRELIDFADRRLYLAKSSGRDQLVVEGGELLHGDSLGDGLTARLIPKP